MSSHYVTSLRVLAVIALGLLVATAGGLVAHADRVYPSEHLDLSPVGGAPLRSGFVENIHVNGPRIFAQELYVLNGAAPNTAYQVTLLLSPFSADCSSEPTVVPTAILQTNVAGNGVARARFAPEDIPIFLRGQTHSGRWQVRIGEIVAYETACTVITFD